MRTDSRILPTLLTLLLALAATAAAAGARQPRLAFARQLAAACEVAGTLSAGASAACLPEGIDRRPLAGGIAHYQIDLQVGSGPWDVVTVHRVVRELAPYLPVSAPRGIFLAHGDRWGFEATYLTSLAAPGIPDPQSLALFLAGAGIDVWGIDFRWARVPAGVDTSFMNDWGLATDRDDLGVALALARAVRLATGSGLSRLHLLGWSRGGQVGYAYLSAESQLPPLLRQVAGFLPTDIYLKTDDEALRQRACERRDQEAAQIAAGNPVATSTLLPLLGQLALDDPTAPSPIFPLFTNAQLVMDLGGFPDPNGLTPGFHAVGVDYDDDSFPVDLLYSRQEHYFAFVANAAISQPRQIFVDAETLTCDEEDSPFDDHLAAVTVPVLYIGAGGGFGSYGLYSTTLLGSTDISSVVVELRPPALRGEDFGHSDLFLAEEAEKLVWQPILDWLLAH